VAEAAEGEEKGAAAGVEEVEAAEVVEGTLEEGAAA